MKAKKELWPGVVIEPRNEKERQQEIAICKHNMKFGKGMTGISESFLEENRAHWEKEIERLKSLVL